MGNRYVIARERNVVRVDFRREPDPPAPKFPGAAALRNSVWLRAGGFLQLNSNHSGGSMTQKMFAH